MIDKKDPRQDQTKADSSDEDLIIDLTDEVHIKTDMEEDELIASAIKESFGSEEDETYEQDDEFDLKASDDDVIILDNEQDVVDESLTAATEDDTSGAARDEDVFDLEEQIELELDEDEDELLALDDERSEDDEDFVSMFLGEPSASKHSDDSEEPAEYLEFDSDRQDDIKDMDDGGDAAPQLKLPADAEALDDIDSEDLPDIEDVTGLDFEEDDDEDDDAENVITLIEEETDSGDNIIARAVERSLGSDGESERLQPAEEAEFESEDDDDLIARNAPRQEDEAIAALKDHAQMDFENDEDLFADLNGVSELEDDDEIIPLDDLENFDAENEEDIVEITEFDQHFPTGSEKILQQAGILDTTDEEEDDFLELIEVEDDRRSEDEKIIGIGESDAKDEYAELDNFFSDDLEEEEEEEELEHEGAGPVFGNAPDDQAESAEQDDEGAEDAFAPSPELPAKTATPDSEDEPFDYNFDSGAIARQVGRLDAFLSEGPADVPEVAALPEDYTPRDKGVQQDFAGGPDPEELSAITAGQIDKAIERVINEKFSGKIENIIYEVIEKAVAKEIDRLKGVLLDNTPPDDNH